MLRAFLEKVLGLVDRLSRAAAWLAMALVAAMIATVLYEVAARHVFNAPTIWSYDVSYMLNGSLFMLAAAETLRRDGHVRIDFLMQMLPRRVRHGLQAVLYLALLAPVLSLGTWFAVTRTLRSFDRGTLENASAWEPLVWPFQAGLSIGLALLLLQTVAEAVRHLVGAVRPDDPLPSSS